MMDDDKARRADKRVTEVANAERASHERGDHGAMTESWKREFRTALAAYWEAIK